MKAVERWKLDSAERVRVFNESHPAPDAASEAVFTLLETRLAQARELAARARSGRAAAAAATAELRSRPTSVAACFACWSRWVKRRRRNCPSWSVASASGR